MAKCSPTSPPTPGSTLPPWYDQSTHNDFGGAITNRGRHNGAQNAQLNFGTSVPQFRTAKKVTFSRLVILIAGCDSPEVGKGSA